MRTTAAAVVVALLCLLTFNAPHVHAYRFVVYSPMFGYSHMRFMGKLADILVEAGHEVDVFMPESRRDHPDTGVKKANATVFRMADDINDSLRKLDKILTTDSWTSSNSNPVSLFLAFASMSDIIERMCYEFSDEHNLVEYMKERRYDVGFAEPFDACGYSLFKLAGINKTATVLSTVMLEQYSGYFGAPITPSYVPLGFANADDHPGFGQRLLAPIFIVFFKYITEYLAAPTLATTARRLGLPHLSFGELVSESSLLFTNSEPLIDFPRPTMHKIIDVGGLTMQSQPEKLNKTWSDLLSLRNQTVFISFGSLAKSAAMPDAFKASFLEVFRRHPDTTFIWKYEEPEHGIGKDVPNLVTVTWAPQPSLLNDRRLSLFLTHSGLGSATESATLGCAVVAVPLFGDQSRNAYMLRRSGIGEFLPKEDLADPEKLDAVITLVLNDPKYRARAHELSSTLKNKPFSARDVLVKNVEFLAGYGPFPQLDPAGRHQSFVVYFLLDVFAVILLVILLLGLALYYLCRFVYRKCFGARPVKAKGE